LEDLIDGRNKYKQIATAKPRNDGKGKEAQSGRLKAEG